MADFAHGRAGIKPAGREVGAWSWGLQGSGGSTGGEAGDGSAVALRMRSLGVIACK